MQRQTIIFVVRIWAEYLAQEPPAWRGEILQPTTGASLPFVTLPDITAFIANQSLCSQTKAPAAQRAQPDIGQQEPG